MYNIIPLVLILISFSLIIVVVVRKFSVLANIDIENMPRERETKMKEQIISSRLKRNMAKWSAVVIKVGRFILAKVSVFSKWAYERLNDIRDEYKKDEPEDAINKKEKAKELFLEIEELKKQEEYKLVEQKLIELIGLDSQNEEAFEELGKVYFEQKNYGDSKETFKHLIKLAEENEDNEELAEAYFNLALVNKATDSFSEALDDIKKALEFNQNNPRYLDTMIEISIINKDKVTAWATLERLEKANPENQKLDELKEKIKEL